MRSATDIVSISTGRETILIGPLSAFGVHSNGLVMRERYSIRQALEAFISRPNAEELLRPHLRRWGIDPLSLRVSTRHTLLDAIARSAANGTIGIAKVPDITLSFAGANLDEHFKGVSLAGPVEGPHLPPGISDRVMIVFDMLPVLMEGETRLSFERALQELGTSAVVSAVVAWIGAHLIPGANLAVLAFDSFAITTPVLRVLEKAQEVVEDIHKAKSKEDLEPAAVAMCEILSVLIAEGVFGRLLKAKSTTKGVGKQGGLPRGRPV